MKKIKHIAIVVLALGISANSVFAFVQASSLFASVKLIRVNLGDSWAENADELGSMLALSDDTGTVTEQYAYMLVGSSANIK